MSTDPKQTTMKSSPGAYLSTWTDGLGFSTAKVVNANLMVSETTTKGALEALAAKLTAMAAEVAKMASKAAS